MNEMCTPIISLDFLSDKEALNFLQTLNMKNCWVRLTNQLFIKYGTKLIEQIWNIGYYVFLDIKLHDLPIVSAASVMSLCKCQIGMLSVQTSGGLDMLKCVRFAQEQFLPETNLIAIGITENLIHPNEEHSDFRKIIETISVSRLKNSTALGYHIMCTFNEFNILKNHFATGVKWIIYGTDFLNFEDKRLKHLKNYNSFFIVSSENLVSNPSQNLKKIIKYLQISN